MNTTPIGLDHNSNLQLHIYVLGHYPMGESVLLIVYEKNTKKVHKSILIDCFERDDVNVFTSVLDYYNIGGLGLDFVVWTHPDKDHSVGFEHIIGRYTNHKKTLYLLPDGVDREINVSLESKKAFDAIAQRHNIVERINTSNRRDYPLVYGKELFVDGYTDSINFEIEVLTPFADRTFNKTECCRGFCINELSISLLVKFGKLNFYFGGDSENPNISLIQEEKLKNLDFIKIPHHGSNSADKLINIIESCNDGVRLATSVSTCFVHGRSKLPEMAVLERYKKLSNSIFLTDRDNRTDQYGMWQFVFDVVEQRLYKPKPQGDATTWFIRA
jgi:beta-lactamase superfamily II metal-dependent hydrolase